MKGTLGAADHRNVRAERWKAALTASHGLGRGQASAWHAKASWSSQSREGSPPQIAITDFFQSRVVSASRHEGVRLEQRTRVNPHGERSPRGGRNDEKSAGDP